MFGQLIHLGIASWSCVKLWESHDCLNFWKENGGVMWEHGSRRTLSRLLDFRLFFSVLWGWIFLWTEGSWADREGQSAQNCSVPLRHFLKYNYSSWSMFLKAVSDLFLIGFFSLFCLVRVVFFPQKSFGFETYSSSICNLPTISIHSSTGVGEHCIWGV